METINIQFAIVGSLSSKPGEAGVIACNSDFLKTKSLYSFFSKIDASIENAQSFYKTLSDDEAKVFQYYFINQDDKIKLSIRAIIRFTKFEAVNRIYNRREYFFLPFAKNFSLKQTKEKLPQAKDYESNENNLNALTIGFSNSEKVDKGSIVTLLESFAKKTTLIFQSTEEEKLLNAVDSLPLVFKKYIQIGLNLLSNDNFAQSKLHVFTCIDTNSNSKTFQSEQTNDKVIDFIANLISSQNYFITEELPFQLNFDYTSKNVLHDLFQIHYKEAIIELILDGNFSNVVPDKISEIKQTFLNEIQKRTNKEKISRYYKALLKINAIDEDISKSFWSFVFSLEDYKTFYNDTLRPVYENYLATAIRNSNSFASFQYFINSIFPSNGSQLKSLKEKAISAFFSLKDSLAIDDLEELINYFIANDKEKLREGLSKINFTNNISKLSDSQYRLLLSQPVIDNLQTSFIYDAISHLGVGGLIKIFPEYNTKKLNSAFVESILQAFVSDSSSFIELLNSQTNWIFNLIEPNRKKEIGNWLLRELEGKIQSSKQDFEIQEYVQILIENKRQFLDSDKRNHLLQSVFDDRIEYLDYQLTIQTILKAARHLNFKLSAYYPNSNDKRLLSYLSNVYDEYSDVLTNKKQLPKIKEEIKRIEETTTKDEIQTSLDKFKRLNSLGTLQHFSTLLENNRDLNDLWVKLLKKDQINEFIQTVTSEDFDPAFFELFMDAKTKVRNSDFEYTNQLREIFRKIDELLAEKHLLKKGIIKIRIMRATKLISRVSKLIIVSLILLTTVSVFAIIFLLKRSNPLKDELNQQKSSIDNLTKENEDLKSTILSLEKSINKQPQIPSLSPIPNSELNNIDLGFINSKKNNGKTIEEIVAVIFKSNPTDIRSHYINQKEAYSEALKKSNPNCFENGICICDSLISIPSYKK